MIVEMTEILALAQDCGFNHVGELNMKDMEFMPEVRDMCAADKCHSYGKTWSCPPAIGTLEELNAKAMQYHRGILVQCTTELEDDFDIEAMMENEERQKKAFDALVAALKKQYPNCWPMGTGACRLCPECTYPDAPCRFPDKVYPSMEACGLFVSRVCKQSGMEYYYGPKTMTYTSCILID